MITLTGADKIRIEGIKGEFLTPVSHETLLKLDVRRLSDARICTPDIRSYTVDLERNTVETEAV